MALPEILNRIHTGRDIFGDALIADNFIVFAPDRIAAEQAMQKTAILFLEFGFKIFDKAITIDLSSKYLPVHGVVVNLFGSSQGNQLLFAALMILTTAFAEIVAPVMASTSLGAERFPFFTKTISGSTARL